MVQNKPPKPRGRPRSYDPDKALAQARDRFWDAGFAATSVDELAAATGMNRPSLYGAFGDKKALYLKTLDYTRMRSRAGLEAALAGDGSLRDALRRVYAGAISIYLSGKQGPRGCFLVGTAATEAVADADVRRAFAASLHDFDDAFAARMRLAQQQGDLDASADATELARLASATLHFLAIRARAGESREALQATADAAVTLICGPAVSRKTRRVPGA